MGRRERAAVPPWLTAAGAALAALLLADMLSAGLGRYALRRGIVDRPGVRKAHDRPTPYLGGVAIAVAALTGGAVSIPYWDRRVTVLVVAGVVVALVGLLDDLRPTHPVLRLAVEVGAATAVVLAGGRIGVFGHWADPVATVAWVVVLANSFNLLDNMDGAAAAVAVPVGCLIAGAAYLQGRSGLALLLITLSAGCLGFLVHNWAPARMFMGDAGSLFIGFLLAAATVLVRVPGGAGARLAELLLFTFVATVDTCLVVIARPRAGLSCFTAGTDHAAHRLRAMGLTVPQVALTLFAVAGLAGLCGVGVTAARLPGVLTLAAAGTGAAALILSLIKVPVYATVPEETPGTADVLPMTVRPVAEADDRDLPLRRTPAAGPGSVLHIDEWRK
ncbi:glycosyltransferase family 4 protein [Actinoallomurus rhizosphaericola]|uniref:glycosyltransferase family 4 protein n=1 Tax=Actinoallomurus rhizosphaericola TaxID=2952536 RepID=UPI002091E8DE|nr:MraY family glycosyltransferase [Actinoallomurus rhizosphaericola]MCO5998169.1 undecaprenyl/decaprenyl-phosphate alpha-N-acetylglucosaminyl 1-phosphate transferase [Actinoallomurus rhizosphaericola]